MKIRRKLAMILGGSYLLIFLTLFVTSNIILMEGFIQQENEDLGNQMQLGTHTLALRVQNLEDTTKALASNDKAYYYMQTGLEHFLSGYLTSSRMIDSELNFIAFLGTNGSIQKSMAFDYHKMTQIKIPMSMYEVIAEHSLEDWAPLTGLIELDEGTLMASVQPILPSDHNGQASGALLCGRYLDSIELDGLRGQSFLDMDIMKVVDAPSIQGNEIVIERPGNTAIVGYQILPDIFGSPYYVLRLTSDRDYFSQGLLITQYFFATSILSGGIIALIAVIASNKYILERMITLGEEVNSINPETIGEESVFITGDDEISNLSVEIDDMLKTIADYRRQLKIRERMATIGQTASMVGHDLRNPLQVILMLNSRYQRTIQNIKDGKDLEKNYLTMSKLGEGMDDQIGYMNKIVSDLQDYSKDLKLEKAYSDVNDLVDNILGSMRIPENINVQLALDPASSNLYVDIYFIRRVLNNLINNAVQAMQDGGTLTLSSKLVVDGVQVEVKDTGSGIKPEDQKTIFTPLFTTKAKGTGLGLAVSKKIVDAHNGEIWFETVVGEGTSFIFTIPFVDNVEESAILPSLENEQSIGE